MGEMVRADIVGSVMEINVQVGDVVTSETTVAVIESMKMEIPAVTEGAGVITEIAVKLGEAVKEGDIIAIVE